MPTLLPCDENNTPIPALRFKEGGAHVINVTATSTRNVTAFDKQTRVISLFATGPVHIHFGSSSVTTTSADHYFPKGVYYDVAIGGNKTAQYSHIAVVSADYDCDLYISEKQ